MTTPKPIAPLRRRRASLVALVSAFSIWSCQQEAANTSKKNGKASNGEVTDVDQSGETETSGDAVSRAVDVDAVFLDKPSSKDEKLAQECAEQLGLEKFRFKKWPAELKTFLAKKMGDFKATDKILQHLSGLYLADSKDSAGQSLIAGLVCGVDGIATRVPLIIDYETMVTSRKKHGALNKVTKYLLHEKGQEKISYIVGDEGDFGLQTLFHELMHIYDLVYIPQSATAEERAAHKEANRIAWKSMTEDKHGIVDTYGLTGFALAAAEPSPSQILLECSKRRRQKPHRSSEGMSLTADDDPFKRDSNDGAFHKLLIEKTSFINQYSSTNQSEDFAESVAIYFTGTRYSDWPSKVYYDFDKNDRRTEVFDFDAEYVAKNSSRHRKKMCAFAKYVLGESCDGKL